MLKDDVSIHHKVIKILCAEVNTNLVLVDIGTILVVWHRTIELIMSLLDEANKVVIAHAYNYSKLF